MDFRSLAAKMNAAGPLVIVNGIVRKKAAPFTVFRIRRSNLLTMVSRGYVKIAGSHLHVSLPPPDVLPEPEFIVRVTAIPVNAVDEFDAFIQRYST